MTSSPMMMTADNRSRNDQQQQKNRRNSSSKNDSTTLSPPSPELQTRFSFYNADEFIVKSPTAAAAETPVAADANGDNATTTITTTGVMDPLPPMAIRTSSTTDAATATILESSALSSSAGHPAAAAVAVSNLPPAADNNTTADDILKSLHDHERQRLQILESDHVHAVAAGTAPSPTVELLGALAAAVVILPSSSGSSSNNSNNNNNKDDQHRHRRERNNQRRQKYAELVKGLKRQEDDDDEDVAVEENVVKNNEKDGGHDKIEQSRSGNSSSVLSKLDSEFAMSSVENDEEDEEEDDDEEGDEDQITKSRSSTTIPPEQDVLLGGPESLLRDVNVLSYEAIAASKSLETFDDYNDNEYYGEETDDNQGDEETEDQRVNAAAGSIEEEDELDGLVHHASQLTLSASSAASPTMNHHHIGGGTPTSKQSTNNRHRSILPIVIRSEDENDNDDEAEDCNTNEDDDDDDVEEEEDFDKEMEDDEVDEQEDGSTSRDTTDVEPKDARRVLGPLSQRCETGVVLEYDDDDADDADASTDTSYSGTPDDQINKKKNMTVNGGSNHSNNNPILDSFSAAVSFVTGAMHSSGEDDDQTDEDMVDDDEEEDDEEDESVEDVFEHPPDWDNSDPDELGYRIVRISQDQLEQLEADYDEESDAQHDEIAKDLAELHAKRAMAAVTSSSAPQRTASDATLLAEAALESFPGVRPAGHGEMGDLEYFSLPIIFKSHVTGFEPTKDWLLEPGNVVAGQYLVEGVLGSAAFSTAYKCVDLNSNHVDTNGKDQVQEEVCLKVIKNTKDFFDQSLDEIKILELLRQTGRCHENYIVEMKTFFYHREHLIIVTELLRQNLFEFGKFISESGEEPYFTIPRLAYVARQCLIALKFVHSLGLVHSDVKPENILLATYSRAIVKLIDFGSSCYVTDRQSSYIQSRSYRAPEVCLGLPYDGRIDVWSLGCVIAEMFTGEVTFQNDSVVSMLSRMEAICGKFPRHMIVQGRQSPQFFTKSGFLFEETSTKNVIDIFQAKRTTLSQRLGFSGDLMRRFDRSPKLLSRSEQQQALFCDFCRQLLTIDSVVRPTAAEALDHPLMQYAATLTEADVIYPSTSSS